MADVKGFFREIDRHWQPAEKDRIPLRVIGSGALLLQTDYVRGTKDGDVLESMDLKAEIKARLQALAGKGTELHTHTKLYLDIVIAGLPFLPQAPKFHAQPELNKSLKHFEISALDVVDVVVSKLTRFSKDDTSDVLAMVTRGLVDHKKLIARFEAAVDRFSTDSRADDIPRYIRNLHKVERDMFSVPETRIDLPDWMQ